MAVKKIIDSQFALGNAQAILLPINVGGEYLCPVADTEKYSKEREEAVTRIQRHLATVGDIITVECTSAKNTKYWVMFAIIAQDRTTHPSIEAVVFSVLVQHLKTLEINSCALPNLSQIQGSFTTPEIIARLEAFLAFEFDKPGASRAPLVLYHIN